MNGFVEEHPINGKFRFSLLNRQPRSQTGTSLGCYTESFEQGQSPVYREESPTRDQTHSESCLIRPLPSEVNALSN